MSILVTMFIHSGINKLAQVPVCRQKICGFNGLRYNSRRMAKAALTFIDLLLVLMLSALAVREFLSIQLGVSPSLPNLARVLGFDTAKVVVLSLCSFGLWYFAKRIRARFKSV
jgi:hypothetical protein